MEIEERHGVRSTFFFRTQVEHSTNPPPSYFVEEYKSEIRSLLAGGWEIGLHMDPSSYESYDKILSEKKTLEKVAGVSIEGNRVHFTMNNRVLHKNLRLAHFKYDSSAKFSREKLNVKDFGFFKDHGLTVFPITVMDALAFAFLASDEKDIISLFKTAIKRCKRLPEHQRIITVIWHDCSLKMKKGRLYPEVLKLLSSIENVEVGRGIDVLNAVESED